MLASPLLALWHCNREQQDLFKVMRAIVPEFTKIHIKLCAQYEIEENTELVSEILNMVM